MVVVSSGGGSLLAGGSRWLPTSDMRASMGLSNLVLLVSRRVSILDASNPNPNPNPNNIGPFEISCPSMCPRVHT